MSKIIKLSSALPGDEVFNGLDAIAPDLELGQRIAAFAVLEVIEINHTKAGDIPKVTLARVEPLGAPGEIPAQIAELVTRAGEARTGSEPLPLDVVVAPTKHPDVCDHRWTVEPDDLADVPAGMVRKTCLTCGYVKYFPDVYEPSGAVGDVCECGHLYDDHDLDDGHCTCAGLVPGSLCDCERFTLADTTPDPDSLITRIDEIAAVVPADADAAVVRPFARKSHR